ncbi:Enolase, partial [Bienertia sinuspersici]
KQAIVAMGQHAGRDEPIGGLNRRVSTITYSSSSTVVMGQHAGYDEPIGGVRSINIHLSSSSTVAMGQHAGRDEPIGGVSRAESLVNSQNFQKYMSKMVKLDSMDAYVLHNLMPDRDATNDKPPFLGRSIVSDMETFSNFVQFTTQFMLFFTLMTETRTSCVRFVKAGVHRQTRPYHGCSPVKRKRYIDAPPKSTHNPSGMLADPSSECKQFGFCQNIPSAITHKVQDRSNVSYDKVLMFWKLLLFQGSMSRVCAPCLSLDWHKLTTVKFHDWSTKVTIKDLRHNIDKLCSAVESSSSNLKRVSPHDEARDAHRSADGHASQHEGTGDNVGDMDFEMGASFNIDDAMIEEAIEPLNVLIDRIVLGKGRDIHLERHLVERSNPASLVQTHYSVDGPSTFEIDAKTLCVPLDAKGIPRAPSHGYAVPAPSISTIRITPASQRIFTSAIRILGNEYLTLLKQTPFDKCKVDEYVWAVKGHIALKASLSDRRRSEKWKKKDLPLNSLTTLEATVHATKRRVEELEAVPVCSAEEMELFQEQERKLLEFQSLLDSSEWVM